MSTIESLERLNQLAVRNAFGVEALDWTRDIDKHRFWGPEALCPLTYLPAYEQLPPEARRRLNQLFSLGVCEQFIWLEENILVRTLRGVLSRSRLSPELTTALGYFIDEELKHTEMFWRVLQKADPDRYRERKFSFFNTSPLQHQFIECIIGNPTYLLVWIWTAIFFEERTVNYCQAYRRTVRAGQLPLDETFVDVHEYHFKDEVRHFQLDQHLLRECYDNQPPWKRQLAGRMFYYVMRSYVAPTRTAKKLLSTLGQEFPALLDTAIPALQTQLPLLGNNREFHQMAFSRQAVPKTLELFSCYRELDRLWPLFIVEERNIQVARR